MTRPFSKTAAYKSRGGLNLDIDGWLRGIGLAQYAEIFRANDIDGELLGRLTNDDLKEIDVASFGHRKKLLEAIAALVTAPGASSPIPVAATEPKTDDTAERRQVTVMFSDLVGSTALSAAWTPRTCARSFRPIRSASRRPWVGSAASWRSTWATVSSSTSAIRKPTEDDVERAVRAGLEFVAAVTTLKAPAPLQTR